MQSQSKVLNHLTWTEAEDSQMILVSNYDPNIKIDPKAKILDELEGA